MDTRPRLSAHVKVLLASVRSFGQIETRSELEMLYFSYVSTISILWRFGMCQLAGKASYSTTAQAGWSGALVQDPANNRNALLEDHPIHKQMYHSDQLLVSSDAACHPSDVLQMEQQRLYSGGLQCDWLLQRCLCPLIR